MAVDDPMSTDGRSRSASERLRGGRSNDCDARGPQRALPVLYPRRYLAEQVNVTIYKLTLNICKTQQFVYHSSAGRGCSVVEGVTHVERVADQSPGLDG